jgi:hypothetical protein
MRQKAFTGIMKRLMAGRWAGMRLPGEMGISCKETSKRVETAPP